jgi:hypothetical protein
MSSWHLDLYHEIDRLVKSDRTVPQAMSEIIDECARHCPHPDWALFRRLDIDVDLEHLRGWLVDAFETPPPERISGLWFGLFNPIRDGEAVADMYVCGSPYDPENQDWACAVSWKPPGAYADSSVLRDVYRIDWDEGTFREEGRQKGGENVCAAEFPLCLGYGALAVRWLLSEIDPRIVLGDAHQRAIFVGFDSGDHICIGALTDDGLELSRDPGRYSGALSFEVEALSPAELLERLRDHDEGIRTEACLGLERLGPEDRGAVPELAAALAESAQGWPALGSIAIALGRIGAPAAPAAPALVRLLEDPEPLNRGAASTALADIGPSAAEQAIPALARALAKDDAWPVREQVASILGRLAVNSPEAIAPLTTALDDPHKNVRKEAARALESLGRR